MTSITTDYFYNNFVSQAIPIGKGGFGIVRRIFEKKTKQ